MPLLRSGKTPSSPLTPQQPSPKTLKNNQILQPLTPAKITEPLSPPPSASLPRRRSLRLSGTYPHDDLSPASKRHRNDSVSPGEGHSGNFDSPDAGISNSVGNDAVISNSILDVDINVAVVEEDTKISSNNVDDARVSDLRRDLDRIIGKMTADLNENKENDGLSRLRSGARVAKRVSDGVVKVEEVSSGIGEKWTSPRRRRLSGGEGEGDVVDLVVPDSEEEEEDGENKWRTLRRRGKGKEKVSIELVVPDSDVEEDGVDSRRRILGKSRGKGEEDGGSEWRLDFGTKWSSRSLTIVKKEQGSENEKGKLSGERVVKEEEDGFDLRRSPRRLSREEKGKGVLEVKVEEHGFDLSGSARKLTREEKGKGVVIEDDDNDDDGDDVDVDDVLVNEDGGDDGLELNLGLNTLNVGLNLDGPGDQGSMSSRDVEELLNRRKLERLSWRKNQHKDIARRRASRFAHFSANDDLGVRYEGAGVNIANLGGVEEAPEEPQAVHVEDWPGPFSTAMKIIRDREKNMGCGKAKNSAKEKGGMPLVSWTPKREKGPEWSKRPTSLLNMSMKILAENVDSIKNLYTVPDSLRHTLSQLLCDSRRMNAHFFRLLIEGSPSEVHVADCSWLEEEEFENFFQACDTSKLTVLQLDLCGHCISDSSLRKALDKSGLPALTTISLKGACRISDAGLSALLSAAPVLRSMNLSQCTLLTAAGIENIAESLGSILHELYLDDCDTLDAMRILPALKKFEHLEVLYLRGIGGVSDKFISELISFSGRNMKELVLANCVNLTDLSLKVITETCPQLCVLDLSHVRKLTDIGMAYLTNGCHIIQVLRLCRNAFSDDAVAAFLETSGESLKELSLNNITKVGQNTTLALARRCRNLEILDLSWCRSLTDEALGLIADSCPSLRLLKIFGCTQITRTFLDGHSNPLLHVIGMMLTPVLEHIERPDFLQGPLHYSAVPAP